MSNASIFNIEWSTEHRRGDKLISRQSKLDPPAPLNCMKTAMVIKYFRESIHYLALSLYQTVRVHYAESHHNKKISEKYRTGEDTPKHTITLLIEILIIKLKEVF